MLCETCGHENTNTAKLNETTDASGRHRANMCERCNCGESEIIHASETDFFFAPIDYMNNPHLWGVRMSYKIRPATRFTL